MAKMDVPANWDQMDTSDKMVEIGEHYAHRPYDLILDVWDIAGESRISRESFDMLLNQTIATYLSYDSEEAYEADRLERY